MADPSKHHLNMGLVKKASKLLGTRQHGNESKGLLPVNEKCPYVQSKGRVGSFIAAQKLKRRRKGTVEAAEAPLAYAKPTMVQGITLTYDTSTRQAECFPKSRAMVDPQRIQIVEDEEEHDDGPIVYHDSESEDEVDESVVEDMRKLEENFKGISQKYRLINRIGEGDFAAHCVAPHNA